MHSTVTLQQKTSLVAHASNISSALKISEIMPLVKSGHQRCEIEGFHLHALTA
jgi:hypothetical protein